MQKTDSGTCNESGSALLSDLNIWREQLARNIARNNIGMRSGEIAETVYRIIFRFCILAIAEDRHHLMNRNLESIADSQELGNKISSLFSSIQDPWMDPKEKVPAPRRSSLTSKKEPQVDDEILRKIIDRLTSPERPYTFSHLTLDQIADTFDQFLSMMIRRSAAHQATVTSRQDTIRRGSYNPSFLDTVVEKTLNVYDTGRSANDTLPLRILDPSCGSGRFLIRTFCHVAAKNRYTFSEKRDFLEQSVYGIDIDPHSVAVTRILLVFAACEGENPRCLPGDILSLFNDLIPVLSHNIRCGNALVGHDIDTDESWLFCPVHEKQVIRAFDWNESFPEVLASGGFDIILSCPASGTLPQREWVQRYFERNYSIYDRKVDVSSFYIEKALNVLRPWGTAGIVTGTSWFHGKDSKKLRHALLSVQIEEIRIFSNETFPSCFLCLTKSLPSHPFTVVYGRSGIASVVKFPVQQHELTDGGWTFRDTRTERIVKKIQHAGAPLESFTLGGIQYCPAGERPSSLMPYPKNKPQIQFSVLRFPPRFILRNGRVRVREETGVIASGNLYIFGLLNSRIASFFFTQTAKKDGSRSITDIDEMIKRFPVYTPDLDDPTDRLRHDRMERLVAESLDLRKLLRQASSDREKQLIRHEIDSVTKQIDSLVYGIYGLSVAEITIVESSLMSADVPEV